MFELLRIMFFVFCFGYWFVGAIVIFLGGLICWANEESKLARVASKTSALGIIRSAFVDMRFGSYGVADLALELLLHSLLCTPFIAPFYLMFSIGSIAYYTAKRYNVLSSVKEVVKKLTMPLTDKDA